MEVVSFRGACAPPAHPSLLLEVTQAGCHVSSIHSFMGLVLLSSDQNCGLCFGAGARGRGREEDSCCSACTQDAPAWTRLASLTRSHNQRGPCRRLHFLSLLLRMSKMSSGYIWCLSPAHRRVDHQRLGGTESSSLGRSVNTPREKMKRCRGGRAAAMASGWWPVTWPCAILGSYDCPMILCPMIL